MEWKLTEYRGITSSRPERTLCPAKSRCWAHKALRNTLVECFTTQTLTQLSDYFAISCLSCRILLLKELSMASINFLCTQNKGFILAHPSLFIFSINQPPHTADPTDPASPSPPTTASPLTAVFGFLSQAYSK